MAEIFLKTGRERSVLRHHPWIFSGAVSKVNGSPNAGETVKILSAQGEFLAWAAYNPNSKIVCRIWTWEESELVNPGFLMQRLTDAINSRNVYAELVNSNAIRLVHGESDGIPGLILDKYGDVLTVQFLTAGVEYWKAEIVAAIIQLTGAKVLYERSDMDVRTLEGLPLQQGILFGTLADEKICIVENDIIFSVDIINGHKTGFYLDQRDNRLIARRIAKGLNVLDCFSYTGGFGINALVGGAKSVCFLDSSMMALEEIRENLTLNGLSMEQARFMERDVFRHLRTLRDSGEIFDLIILDPPKFAPTSSQAERAARGYKDINLLALKLLKPGGYLMTFSCSGGVSEELFQKIVTGAALDAKAEVVILQRLHQACDHPVALNFPEGAYLKGFLLQKRV